MMKKLYSPKISVISNISLNTFNSPIRSVFASWIYAEAIAWGIDNIHHLDYKAAYNKINRIARSRWEYRNFSFPVEPKRVDVVAMRSKSFRTLIPWHIVE